MSAPPFLPPHELQRRFEQAQRLLKANRAQEAAMALEPVAAAAPSEPAVRLLLSQVRYGLRDLEGAIREQRAGAALVPRDAGVRTGLANLLAQAERAEEAEAEFRRALSADARFVPAACGLVSLLLSTGRAADAAAVLAPFGEASSDPQVLAAHASVAKAQGRKVDVLRAHERLRDLHPASAAHWHNVAASAGDLQRFADAEAASARAHALGSDAPETWLVRARALHGLDRLDEAEAAFVEALRRRPAMLDAHRDLAQLVWMRTGDAGRALAHMEGALAADPTQQALAVERARLLDYAGRREEADAGLAPLAARPQAGAGVLTAATQLAVHLDPDRAAAYAERALALLPDTPEVWRNLAEARLAQGRNAEAGELADRLAAAAPDDGGALALQATTRRLLGDPRAAALHDYDRLVRARRIDAPPGWPDLPAYLRDLAAGLERLHVNTAHPVGQSVRGGAQTNANLLESDDPAVRAFPRAVDGPIRAYIAALGEGADPVRRRNTGAYRFHGAWSVRLREGGRHADHMHPEGWIRFGEAGLVTHPKLEAEHWVKPEPGLLVLFPSCMWHGTTPFSGETPRLTVAFDLLPA